MEQRINIAEFSTSERLLLAEQLLDSVYADHSESRFSADQLALVQQRVDAIDRGEVKTIPWEEARQRLLSKLN